MTGLKPAPAARPSSHASGAASGVRPGVDAEFAEFTAAGKESLGASAIVPDSGIFGQLLPAVLAAGLASVAALVVQQRRRSAYAVV